MGKLLHSYYQGVLRRLRSEVDFLNQVIPHSSTRGGANEISLRNSLVSLIPQKYSVGSGIIIDSFGNESKQIDIIIYDSHAYPNLFSQSGTAIFPVETVIAAIEVKTYLDGSKLTDVFDNTHSIRSLRHYVPEITVNQPTPEYPMRFMRHPTRPPLSILLAFRVDSQDPATWKTRFMREDRYEDIPEASLLLDIATVFRFQDISVRKPKQFQGLYFPLTAMDGQGNIVEGQSVFHGHPNQLVAIGTELYRSASFQRDSHYPILMPERAFLSFLLSLNMLLDMYPKHITFDPTKYLDPLYSHGLLI